MVKGKTQRYFLTCMKSVSLCDDQCYLGQPDEQPASRVSICGKNFEFAIFLDTINMLNVKLCMMVILTVFYSFIPLSVTLIVFQGHSIVKQF